MQIPEFKMSEEIPWGSARRGKECRTSGRAEKEKKERRYQSASRGLASAGWGGKLNHLVGSRYKFMAVFEVLCFNSVFLPSPVHQALVDLQLQTGVQVRFLSTWKDFTDYITMSTKAVAEAPFKWVGSHCFHIYRFPTSCIFSYCCLFLTFVYVYFSQAGAREDGIHILFGEWVGRGSESGPHRERPSASLEETNTAVEPCEPWYGQCYTQCLPISSAPCSG